MSDVSSKTYTIGGTSVDAGRRTFRFANGKLNVRVNMLRHFEHTAIKLVKLPRPMTKKNATAWLLTQGFKGVVPTRATNKRAKSPILVQAEKIASKRIAKASAEAVAA